ncbi:MAG: alpha/beta hydrolase [Pseudomonadota bacterium]
MPENAAAEGGFGRDAPSRSDNDNDRGGAREDKESRAEKAESFERAMDNANRPDRAPAEPSDTTTVADDNDDDNRNTTDKTDDRQDRSFFDRVADTLTAPPTDAEGNARSTSPVADRVRNHTRNYSLDDLRNVFTDDPGLTPEQSQALADGAAVMEGVAVMTTTPKEQLSLYQADLRLQQRGLEYQRELLGENIHPRSPKAGKAAVIDRQLDELAQERKLVETVSRPDLATGIEPEILHFDPKDDGQIVVGYGDIANASHIAVVVPGTGAALGTFATTERRSMELMKALQADPSISSPAVVGYLGYDAPDTVFFDGFEAMSDDLAVEGAPVFADFLNSLPEDAQTHVFAHSYASLLAGKALMEGGRPDYVHALGSPGMGFDSIADQAFEGDVVITHTGNPGDMVVFSEYFGEVPPSGAISYPSTGRGHVDDPDDLSDANYFSPEIMRDIIAGRRQPLEENLRADFQTDQRFIGR